MPEPGRTALKNCQQESQCGGRQRRSCTRKDWSSPLRCPWEAPTRGWEPSLTAPSLAFVPEPHQQANVRDNCGFPRSTPPLQLSAEYQYPVLSVPGTKLPHSPWCIALNKVTLYWNGAKRTKKTFHTTLPELKTKLNQNKNAWRGSLYFKTTFSLGSGRTKYFLSSAGGAFM